MACSTPLLHLTCPRRPPTWLWLLGRRERQGAPSLPVCYPCMPFELILANSPQYHAARHATPELWPYVAAVVGGHWSSGVPYLSTALKRSWAPRQAGSASLEGVQLVLLRADAAALKVSRHDSAPVALCLTAHVRETGRSMSCLGAAMLPTITNS